MLGRTANPLDPEQVEVSRPSDALAAKSEADSAFTSLLLGLGAVALVVGAIGIANVMVVAVLERRNEIGLRRALGATKRAVRTQFLCESLVIGTAGGLLGLGARRRRHGRLRDPARLDGRRAAAGAGRRVRGGDRLRRAGRRLPGDPRVAPAADGGPACDLRRAG